MALGSEPSPGDRAPRVAILGSGWGARVQVPAFRRAGWQVVGIWSRTAEGARRAAREHELPLATTDARELIERRDLDLASVVTPPALHRELAVAALDAGHHVLCEKPMALDAEAAAAMLGAARRHPDRLALIDHELRFLPTRARLRRLVGEGWVGRVHHVETAFFGGGRLGDRQGWNWWSDRRQGGGILGAACSHLVDALCWLLDDRVARVSAQLGTAVGHRTDAAGAAREVTSDDHAALLLAFQDGVQAVVQASAAVAGPRMHRLLIAGAEGSLRLDDERLTGHRAAADRPEDLTVEEDASLFSGLRDDAWGRGTFYLAGALRRAVQGGDRGAVAAAATFASGLHVQRVLDAARRAAEAGVWVEVARG